MLERSCAVQGIDRARADKLLALHTMEEGCIRGEWRREREKQSERKEISMTDSLNERSEGDLEWL
jgi:hypothetical protein